MGGVQKGGHIKAKTSQTFTRTMGRMHNESLVEVSRGSTYSTTENRILNRDKIYPQPCQGESKHQIWRGDKSGKKGHTQGLKAIVYLNKVQGG